MKFSWLQNFHDPRFKGTLSKKSSLDGKKNEKLDSNEPEIASEMYFETLKLIVVMKLSDIRTFDTYNATWDNLLRFLDIFIN